MTMDARQRAVARATEAAQSLPENQRLNYMADAAQRFHHAAGQSTVTTNADDTGDGCPGHLEDE
jgi:hypothetical protein